MSFRRLVVHAAFFVPCAAFVACAADTGDVLKLADTAGDQGQTTSTVATSATDSSSSMSTGTGVVYSSGPPPATSSSTPPPNTSSSSSMHTTSSRMVTTSSSMMMSSSTTPPPPNDAGSDDAGSSPPPTGCAAGATVITITAAAGKTCGALPGSGNFDTTGAVCVVYAGNVDGWEASSTDGRTLTVVGATTKTYPAATSQGGMNISAGSDGNVYWNFGAGQNSYAAMSCW